MTKSCEAFREKNVARLSIVFIEWPGFFGRQILVPHTAVQKRVL